MQILNLNAITVISVSGDDAEQFLQAQLTQAIKSLPAGGATFAGLCTAKGRLLATFIVFRSESGYFLLTHASLAQALIKRMKMFVLRSKVTIDDVSSGYELSFLSDCAGTVMSVEPISSEGQGFTVRLRPVENSQNPMGLVMKKAASTQSQRPEGDGEGDLAFEAALIKLGIPLIKAETQEKFVPQQINFDLVGGVSFTKGCYPGQEVVARSHYLGKSKKRAFIGQIDSKENLLGGQDIWLEGKDNEPVGMVVNAAPTQEGTILLFEAPIEAAENSESVFLVAHEATRIKINRVLPPPYDVHAKGSQFE